MTDKQYWLQFEKVLPKRFKLDCFTERKYAYFLSDRNERLIIDEISKEIIVNTHTMTLMDSKFEIKL